MARKGKDRYDFRKKPGRPKKGRPIHMKVDYKVGRPPRYRNAQELLDGINQYFKDGFEKKKVVVGRPPHQQVIFQNIMSITGLALYLGFNSIHNFDQQVLRGSEFKGVVMYGKTMVARHYEGLMQSGVAPSAMVFMLSSITGMKAEQPVLDQSSVIRQINFVVPKTKTKVIDIESKDVTDE